LSDEKVCGTSFAWLARGWVGAVARAGGAFGPEIWLGVNYWSRAGGPDMWLEFDAEVIEQELRQLKEYGIGLTRAKDRRTPFASRCSTSSPAASP